MFTGSNEGSKIRSLQNQSWCQDKLRESRKFLDKIFLNRAGNNEDLSEMYIDASQCSFTFCNADDYAPCKKVFKDTTLTPCLSR